MRIATVKRTKIKLKKALFPIEYCAVVNVALVKTHTFCIKATQEDIFFGSFNVGFCLRNIFLSFSRPLSFK